MSHTNGRALKVYNYTGKGVRLTEPACDSPANRWQHIKSVSCLFCCPPPNIIPTFSTSFSHQSSFLCPGPSALKSPRFLPDRRKHLCGAFNSISVSLWLPDGCHVHTFLKTHFVHWRWDSRVRCHLLVRKPFTNRMMRGVGDWILLVCVCFVLVAHFF